MNPAPPPLRTLTPKQEERASETFLISSLVAMLHNEWRGRVDERVWVEIAEAWAPALPRTMIRALESTVDDLTEEPDEHDRAAEFSLLMALTNRLLGLDLPKSNADIFSGPPIVSRRRDALPTGHLWTDSADT
jgi:hypothetical protein